VGADKSTRHLCKMFHWLFLSQHGLRALPNSRITFGSFFGDDFPVGTDSIFVHFFWNNKGYQGLWATLNPRLTFERSISDDFGVDSDVVFFYYFWVNRGYGRWRIYASPLEIVSLTFSKSTGVVSSSETTDYLSKVFQWRFPVSTHSVFVDFFRVKGGCERFQIFASPL